MTQQETLPAEALDIVEEVKRRVFREDIPEVERQCRVATGILLKLSDNHDPGATWALDGLGFSKREIGFAKDLYAQENPYTERQLLKLYEMVNTHRAQLERVGFTLPEQSPVTVLATQKKAATSAKMENEHTKITIGDYQGNPFIFITIPYPRFSDVMSNLKTEFYNKVNQYGGTYCGPHNRGTMQAKAYYDGEKKHWRFPLTVASWELITSDTFFPVDICELSERAQEYHRNLAQEAQKLIEEDQAKAAAIEAEYQKRVNELGGFDAEFLPNMHFFPHQIEALQLLFKRDRALVADEPGLGKTVEAGIPAMVLQRLYGYRIFIVCPVSAMEMWRRFAEQVGMTAEIYSWGSIPKVDNDYPANDFIFIADEAHLMGNLEAKRTRAALELALHPRCKHYYPLTGTPMKNRPKDLYTILLALKHPLVYSDLLDKINYPIVWDSSKDEGVGMRIPGEIYKKRIDYQNRYCGRYLQNVGRKNVWNINGATNIEDLNKRVAYVPGRENHPDACMISRRKTECYAGMPEKIRVKQPVELTPEATETYKQRMLEAWEAYLAGIEEKVNEFMEKNTIDGIPPLDEVIAAERQRVSQGQQLVLGGHMRHAGAIAKAPQSAAMAEQLLEWNNKVVIFTHFIDAAREMGRLIEENTGKRVGFVTGEENAKQRNSAIDDFQDPHGTIQTLICTAAGSASITLTAASYMIHNDRTWTPGDTEQEENRIHRLGITKPCTIFWMQIPVELSVVDGWVDGIIEEKQENISLFQYGEREELKFAKTENINSMTVNIMKATLDLIKGKKPRSKKSTKKNVAQ